MASDHKIWFDGQLVAWEDANVHVTAHALHYGSSIFEGIRAYETPDGPAVLGLERHTRRFFDSAKIFRMELPFDPQTVSGAILETLRVNGHPSAYIRPLAIRGAGPLGVDGRRNAVNVIIITLEWGAYLGEEALEQGVDVCVSSWRRMAPDTHPAMGKIGGNYVNSQLVVMEARERGYTEGIALDVSGLVSEGSGENLFLIKEQTIYTPPVASSILAGITRGFVLELIEDHGFTLREQNIPREMLYVADELFFTGTAAEVTPIRSVDGYQIGAGRRGPMTEAIQSDFFDIVNGRREDRHQWLTHVHTQAPQPAD